MTKNFTDRRVSSHSEAGGNCVEVGRSTDGMIGVRDTKADGHGMILQFTRREWAALLAAVRADS